MSTSQNSIFESALSLSQNERADLAFQLLQSLHVPGEEIPSEEFGAELRDRVAAFRRGEVESSSLEDARASIRQRLSEAEGHK
jgi:putative addiction module component (TIGR02574 family)